MPRIAVIDDERSLRHAIGIQLAGYDIVEFESPLDLRNDPEAETITHAIIDLSYGSARSGCTPLRSNALNAMLALDEVAPTSQRLVMSVLGGPRYRELARAVQQFWPDTPMLLKSRLDAFPEDLRRFANNDSSLSSHAEALEEVRGVKPWDRWRDPGPGVASMMSTIVNGNPYKLIRTFACFDYQPSRSDLIEHFGAVQVDSGMTDGAMRNKLAEFRGTVEYWLTDSEQTGARLWSWCEPRWPIFEAADPDGPWTTS